MADSFDYKTEYKEDGYEVESYIPFGNKSKPRRFTVWPPSGNAVGDYSSIAEAKTAIKQWKDKGNKKLLKQDGGANYKVKNRLAFQNGRDKAEAFINSKMADCGMKVGNINQVDPVQKLKDQAKKDDDDFKERLRKAAIKDPCGIFK